MGSSLAAGLRALPGDCAAAVIALVDQPLIGPDAVRRLIAAYRAGAERCGRRLSRASPQPGAAGPRALGRGARGGRGRRRGTALPAGPSRTWSRWWSARTPAAPTTWIPRTTWPGSAPCWPACRSRWASRPGADGLDPPGVRDGIAGFQGEQVGAGDERVRRAGHGLDGDRAPAVLRAERVPGEDLQPAVARAGPERDSGPVAGQPCPGPAGPSRSSPVNAWSSVHRPDRPGGAEVERRARPRPGRPGRDAAPSAGSQRLDRQGELASVDDRRARRSGTGASRCRTGPAGRPRCARSRSPAGRPRR